MTTAATKRYVRTHVRMYVRDTKCQLGFGELTSLREVARPSRRASQKLGVLLLLPSVVGQQAVQRGALLQLEGVEGAVLIERDITKGEREHGQNKVPILTQRRRNGHPCAAD